MACEESDGPGRLAIRRVRRFMITKLFEGEDQMEAKTMGPDISKAALIILITHLPQPPSSAGSSSFGQSRRPRKLPGAISAQKSSLNDGFR